MKRTPAHDGFASVTLLVSFEVVLSPISAKPKHPKKPCVVETFIMTHHVTLCAPAGVDITCRASGECRCTLVDRVLSKPCPIIDELLVDCELDLCLLVQAKADVNLLVPSYCTCEASLCETRERPCPPPAITR